MLATRLRSGIDGIFPDLIFVQESDGYSGTIFSIHRDDTHLYIHADSYLHKHLRSDLGYVAKSDKKTYIQTASPSGPYVYTTGSTGRTIIKFAKSNMKRDSETVDQGGVLYTLTSDGTHVYVSAGSVRKILCSDLSHIGSSSAVEIGPSPSTSASVIDSTYVYVGTNKTRVRRYRKDTLALVDETASYGGTINAIAVDDNYVYVAGATTQTVRKYSKSNFSYIGETASYGGTINAIAVDDNYVYVAGATTQTVRKYSKSNFSYIGETVDYGGTIRAILVSGTSLYVVGESTRKIIEYYTAP